MVTFNDIKINPVYETLLPPLTEDEFNGLEANILSNKDNPDRDDPLDDAIHILAGSNYIIDGHNRYKILKSNNMTTNKISVHNEFKCESDILSWIRDHQSNRRNLKRSELVRINMKIEEQVQKEARERQIANIGGDKRSQKYKESVGSNLTQQKDDNSDIGRTAEIMAKKSGFGSKNTWNDAKLIIQKGSPEKIRRMDKGGRGNGIATIAQEIRDEIPDGQRKCSKCGKIKKLEDFVLKEKQASTVCKECRNKYEIQNKKKKQKIKYVEANEKYGELGAEVVSKSYAPVENYYDNNQEVKWTYDDARLELLAIFDKAISETKNFLLQHKEDVFNSNDNLNKVADEIQLFASNIKFLEHEIRDKIK